MKTCRRCLSLLLAIPLLAGCAARGDVVRPAPERPAKVEPARPPEEKPAVVEKPVEVVEEFSDLVGELFGTAEVEPMLAVLVAVG